MTAAERCYFEIALIHALPDNVHPAWLTGMGEADWHAELYLIHIEANPPMPSMLTGPGGA
jgi:hypothetical protein